MVQDSSTKNDKKRESAGAPAATEEDLRRLFGAYRDAAEKLHASHATLQREVVRLRAELEEKRRLAVLGEMSAGVAHEIRNSLGVIELYASMLERGLEADADLCPMARKILAGVGTIDGIIKDLLTYAAQVRLNPTRCSLAALVREAEERVHAQLNGSAVRVVSEVPEGFMLNADVEHFTRVLTNLLLNAIQAVGQEGLVRVCAVGGAGRVSISIADSGPGVEESALQKVFEPFFTTRDGGVGLGLAIVRRIVEAHNGGIRAENNPEGGAVFIVDMPVES